MRRSGLLVEKKGQKEHTMDRARPGESVCIGFAVLLALLALQVSTGQASAQGQSSITIAPQDGSSRAWRP